ncbi:MAG: ATP-dependent DNA helicase RecG, partial [Deltaproteobacteria bacterium]|nr:ATP-dependent DNA helicase RecG [Deltaproteobacteria bacterium]
TGLSTTPLSGPVRYVKGVGERMASLLARLNVFTVEDLLYFFPYRYEDRRNLRRIAEISEGPFRTVTGIVRYADLKTTARKRFRILQALIEDPSGTLMIKWFNQAYLKKVLQPGKRIILSGKVKRDPYTRALEMENPEYEFLQGNAEETIHTNRIVPIYHTTAGITQRRLRSILFQFVESCAPGRPDCLPEDLRSRLHLPVHADSLMQLHFPNGNVSVEQLNAFRSPYHKRMIFEEFFLMETLLALSRQSRSQFVRGISFSVETPLKKQLLSSLPFALTTAQKRVIGEIQKDMARPVRMSRLLQGDVGCGKTVVAATAAAIALDNGCQVAVMAPTEILAEQLYLNFHTFFDGLGQQTALLTRVVKNAEKEQLRKRIAAGEIGVVVGTQALIQKEIAFQKLGLVIIDEQHRFGVFQRATLMEKGDRPDVLVMTATPIPRSLSLTVYGDLDISVIDELPAGRTPIRTRIIRSREKAGVFRKIEQEIAAGRQAYIVYPLVEETEKSDLAAATEMSEELATKIFPQRRVGLIHSRVKTEEKERIMAAFKKKQLDILVSTTVVEVGIDIPNASVIMVEHAERFGLAQLHQLRGRVGRGRFPSFCFLSVSGRMTPEARRRLAVMETTTDGFRIAEEDLAIRGPGEFFGRRQSGLPDLKLGDILRDARILEAARNEAFERVERDPQLQARENRELAAALRKRYVGKNRLIRVG